MKATKNSNALRGKAPTHTSSSLIQHIRLPFIEDGELQMILEDFESFTLSADETKSTAMSKDQNVRKYPHVHIWINRIFRVIWLMKEMSFKAFLVQIKAINTHAMGVMGRFITTSHYPIVAEEKLICFAYCNPGPILWWVDIVVPSAKILTSV